MANIKIATLLKVIADDNNGIGISRSTFKRMLRKAKKLGLLTIYKTMKSNGYQGANIYVFNRI